MGKWGGKRGDQLAELWEFCENSVSAFPNVVEVGSMRNGLPLAICWGLSVIERSFCQWEVFLSPHSHCRRTCSLSFRLTPNSAPFFHPSLKFIFHTKGVVIFLWHDSDFLNNSLPISNIEPKFLAWHTRAFHALIFFFFFYLPAVCHMLYTTQITLRSLNWPLPPFPFCLFTFCTFSLEYFRILVLNISVVQEVSDHITPRFSAPDLALLTPCIVLWKYIYLTVWGLSPSLDWELIEGHVHGFHVFIHI